VISDREKTRRSFEENYSILPNSLFPKETSENLENLENPRKVE
jgi:hypothetical protein